MLYPKKDRALTDEDFKYPASEYRAAPFWAWNTGLDKDELIRQIEIFKEMGFGGFHMHVRTGMTTEYLSDEFMALIGACVEKAGSEKMLSWLYDEDRWPSGAAGGFVTKNPAYRTRHLLLTRKPYAAAGEVVSETISKEAAGEFNSRTLLACFDVVLDADGNLSAYRRIGENDNAEGFKFYAYEETAAADPWYNNQTYLDTLNPQAVREFIRITHERYAKYFQKDFGTLIPAIFTDEPQFSMKGTLRFALEDRDLALPWTGDFPKTYSEAYNGEDIIAAIPELVWELPNGVSPARYHYHDHVTERLASAFIDQCGAWCSAHNLMLTGHMVEEPTLLSQTHAIGEAMRFYRSFQLPGIDMLCDRREFTTAKQAQSAARQYGRPGVSSELYGVTNWDFDFRGHKLQGDWQAALGVTVRIPHLSWVSMNGNAKRDYPGTFNYQAPWYKEYRYIEDHFARLASALTRGKAVCRIGVIHPIESYWLHWGPGEKTEVIRTAMDERFQNLCDWLLRGFIDFDYICESELTGNCDVSEIGKSTEIKFPVGKMNYDAVIVPALETVRAGTLERLEAFRDRGGKVIFLGSPPVYVDAVRDDWPLSFYKRCEHIGFDRLAVLESLEEYREVRILKSTGAASDDFLHQLREEEDGTQWLFICHADREKNIDNPYSDDYRIQIRGVWEAVEYDTVNGTIRSRDTEIINTRTCLKARLWDHDSLLLKLVPSVRNENLPKNNAVNTIETDRNQKEKLVFWDAPVPVTLHEPNVLLLDIADYALDNGNWRGKEEILRLDNILRRELNLPLRKKAVAQPWAEHDASTPHTLRLRFTFESTETITGTELALENASVTEISLNGENAGSPEGWYVDKCINKVKLPEIKKGTNVLELVFPYGRKVDAEACYLLGDFSVTVRGTRCTLGKPVRSLAFGDICNQGLPFYGGNITYHLEAECTASSDNGNGSLAVEASSYRFMLLKAAVDGIDRGHLVYAPYRLKIDGLSPGLHKIDLTGFGCRINTFGQLHNNHREKDYWWGPDSWRSEGTSWSYEYCFHPQGILKSPEIY